MYTTEAFSFHRCVFASLDSNSYDLKMLGGGNYTCFESMKSSYKYLLIQNNDYIYIVLGVANGEDL